MSRRDSHQVVELYTDAQLQQRAAADDYRNRKRVNDAVYRLIAWGILALGLLGVASAAFTVYFYLFSSDRNPKALLQLATDVLVYIAGVVTPVIQRILTRDEQS